MKTRILALVLALMCLITGMIPALSEEKPVEARLVLDGLERIDDGSVTPLDGESPDNLDVITLYADKTAMIDIRYTEDGAVPPQVMEGTWEHYQMGDLDLYEIALPEQYGGGSWPIRREGDFYVLHAYSGMKGMKRLMRLEQPASDQPAAETTAQDALPDIVSGFTVPFEGDPAAHREALWNWSLNLLNWRVALEFAASGAIDGFTWERYDLPNRTDSDTYRIYIIMDAAGERVLAYASEFAPELSIAPADTFAEAVRMVDAGFDGTKEDLAAQSYAEKASKIAEEFDTERMEREMAALGTGVPDHPVTVYYRYGHYLTICPGETEGRYWAIYHNTPQDGGLDALVGGPESIPEPAPALMSAADGSWTCENGHGGNTGNFCAECGAPKPAKAGYSFCPNCGQDLRNLDAKFCPSCGTPVA